MLFNTLWQNDEQTWGYKWEFIAYVVILCLSNFEVTGEKFSLEAEMCEPMEHGLQYIFSLIVKKYVVALLISQ
jgi:hypothetical protein